MASAPNLGPKVARCPELAEVATLALTHPLSPSYTAQQVIWVIMG